MHHMTYPRYTCNTPGIMMSDEAPHDAKLVRICVAHKQYCHCRQLCHDAANQVDQTGKLGYHPSGHPDSSGSTLEMLVHRRVMTVASILLLS